MCYIGHSLDERGPAVGCVRGYEGWGKDHTIVLHLNIFSYFQAVTGLWYTILIVIYNLICYIMKQNVLVFQCLLERLLEIDMKSLIYILQDNRMYIFKSNGLAIWFRCKRQEVSVMFVLFLIVAVLYQLVNNKNVFLVHLPSL